MKETICVTIMLFTLPSLFFGQICTLVDKQTKEPVAYAHVVLYMNDTIVGGEYSNDKGEVYSDLEINIDKLSISHLTYRDTVIPIEFIDKVVYLEEEALRLMSTTVFASNKESIAFLGQKRSSSEMLVQRNANSRALLLIKNPYEVEKQLKSFVFYSKSKMKDVRCLYKIVFLENDENVPGKKLPYERVFSLSKEKKKRIEIELEEENIYIPVNGFFVGLECMGVEREDVEKIEENQYGAIRSIGLDHVKKEKNEAVFYFESFLKGYGWINTSSDYDFDSKYVFVPAFGVQIFE